MSESGINSLVFLDESGININMTRHYARSKRNERAVDSTPLNTPCNTTVLSSILLNGRTAYTVYQGGTTAERFAEYLENTLIPTLSREDIDVMDNMRSHHAKIVKQVLDTSGIRYLYLPPYSPDLNPIEKMWSKIKAYLRKEKIRIVSGLPDAIERAFSIVTVSDCLGWFRVIMCNNLLDCYSFKSKFHSVMTVKGGFVRPDICINLLECYKCKLKQHSNSIFL